MNINIHFLRQTLLPIRQILLATTIVGFSYSAIATDVVTDDQIRRVAKIAKATKTDITITKERVTVTVHAGSGKKNAKKIKKIVSKIMKQKNYMPKQSSYYEDSTDVADTPPVLNNTGFRPPPSMSNQGYRQPPTLNNSSSSHAPTLDKSGTEDYY
jgi:hypothetical protein